ncbi:MAG: hypothetical protein LQ343_000338 [Gyalolechia ehrenbergii]|nr:MAG: hypothetical protein LQ343_000338 [Gyalolechia ehrenbergii]
MPPPSPPLVVALSGLSSTGKSSVASRLPSIFLPPRYALTILHVDDFYKPQPELPLRDGLLDWDCAGSLDWPRLEVAVRKWRNGEKVEEGHVNPQPEFNASAEGEEGQDEGGGITKTRIEELGVAVRSRIKACQRILILDGFLLFARSVPSTFRSLLDLKVLLRAPYAQAKRRREARSGYTTMEGWWEDPPGYFDKVVWPNYVEENRGFFVGENVEGRVDEEACGRGGVRVCEGKEGGLGEVLSWVVGEIIGTLEKV